MSVQIEVSMQALGQILDTVRPLKTASKNVVDMYEELQELGFPVRWVILNRSFIVEGGTLRYTGLRFGRKTYLTEWLLAR